MGGSLGMAAGEAIVRGLELAVEKKSPFIVFAASGGARMQEGILSLMQMPRTTVAVQMLREAKQPYIVVLTNPTTGGVTASYAMLGDVQIAEPGALIGFAGARVIEQTIREKLPEGFQRAEYLKDHGMVDMVVHRHELRPTLARLCRLLTKAPALEAAPKPHPTWMRRPSQCPSRTRGAVCAPRVSAACANSRRLTTSIARLSKLHPKKIDLTLERMQRILERLDHPERKLPPVIHVAGTNGKGSTVAYLRAILEAAGLSVHVYTSPFLVRLNECVAAGRNAGQRRGTARRAAEVRARQRRRADHAVRDEDRCGLCAVREKSGRRAAAGGRPRRPARQHQRDRDAAGQRHHAYRHGSHRISRRLADADCRREGRGLSSAACP